MAPGLALLDSGVPASPVPASGPGQWRAAAEEVTGYQRAGLLTAKEREQQAGRPSRDASRPVPASRARRAVSGTQGLTSGGVRNPV
jgi:hypothetical protein